MDAMGNENRSTTPQSSTFKDFIFGGWAERPEPRPRPRAQATYAAERRARISAMHQGERLLIPAGPAKTRSNDTDYPYRAHSAFSYLTGWGSDAVPGAVLVLEPTAKGHDATVFLLPTAGRDSEEFYANAAIGEFWTGPRPSLAHVAADLGVETAHLDEFAAVLDATDGTTRIVREADRDLTDQIDGRRLLAAELGQDAEATIDENGDSVFARDLSEMRLVKDDYEIREMRLAIDATKQGFDDVIADLPQIVAHPRGERLVEGTFNRRARAEGNQVGYDTIAASGPHACILHWTRNDGPVNVGDLILLDAGIELDSLYTADITRTLPISGTFTDVQRRVYEAVLEAADAARAIVKPGIEFREVHAAAMAGHRPQDRGMGLPAGERRRVTRPRACSTTAATWCTARATTSASTCTTARRPAASCTWTARCSRAWCSRSSRGSTSSPTTCRCRRSSAASACASKTTCWLPQTAARTCRRDIPRTADEVEAWLRG